MRSIFILLFFLSLNVSYAKTYYVKSAGGSGSGLDDDNAWSLVKLNSSHLAPGDIVLFKRGDVFNGGITLNQGGSAGNKISFSAYGTGNSPVISGFTQLKSWTLLKGNIYYASIDLPVLNMVTINGEVKQMGRYPNTGYLTYKSHTNNTSITSAASLPFNAAGGEVVIRKERWILDRHPITAITGNTIVYSTNNDHGIDNAYSPIDGNGYFIQNSLGTLDQDGEWYYDKISKRLYIYSGSGVPDNKIVSAASIPQLVPVNSLGYLLFSNIDFSGGDYAFYLQSTSNVDFVNCNFSQQGISAIYAINSNNINISGGSISYSNNNGLWAEWNVSGLTVSNVTVTNIATMAGMGRSGDGNYIALKMCGSNLLIENNIIKNTGFNGIDFTGNNVIVRHNLVDRFCTVKDDGGGIYTYNGSATANNRVIKNNIVLNAIGAFAGAEANYWEAWGKTCGIYLDGGSNHTLVDSNTVAHGPWGGIFLNYGDHNQVTNNLVYDHAKQLLIIYGAAALARDLTVTGNTFIAKTAQQTVMYIRQESLDNVGLIGNFNNNTYARPIDDNQTIMIFQFYTGGGGEIPYSLDSWSSAFKLDKNSKKSWTKIANVNSLKFDYNFSALNSSLSINGCWNDMQGFPNQSTEVLAPYFGKVLIAGAQLAKPVVLSN